MLTVNKFSTRTFSLLFIAASLIISPVQANPDKPTPIVLESSKLTIVFSDKEPGPLKIALEAFKKDFVSVLGTEPAVAGEMSADRSRHHGMPTTRRKWASLKIRMSSFQHRVTVSHTCSNGQRKLPNQC